MLLTTAPMRQHWEALPRCRPPRHQEQVRRATAFPTMWIQFAPGGTATGVLAAKGIGAQPVTVTGVTLTGAGAGNYTVVQQTGLVQNVIPKALTVTGLTITNPPPALAGTAGFQTFKTPGLGSGSDGNPYTNDTVSVSGTPVGTLATNSARFNLIVNVSGLSLAGADAANYSLSPLVLVGPTANGPAYYLDVNGADPGFGDPNGLTIDGNNPMWSTNSAGTNATDILPYWYDGTTHPIQLTFGNPGTSGISNSTFTVSGQQLGRWRGIQCSLHGHFDIGCRFQLPVTVRMVGTHW